MLCQIYKILGSKHSFCFHMTGIWICGINILSKQYVSLFFPEVSLKITSKHYVTLKGKLPSSHLASSPLIHLHYGSKHYYVSDFLQNTSPDHQILPSVAANKYA